jgi:hypothetical protein
MLTAKKKLAGIIMLSPQVEGLKRHPFVSKHEVFNDAIKR